MAKISAVEEPEQHENKKKLSATQMNHLIFILKDLSKYFSYTFVNIRNI